MEVVPTISRSDRVAEALLGFAELMKPELTGLSVLTALFAFHAAPGLDPGVLDYLLMALGTLAVGGGAGVLNQWMERDLDALMKRTERRPLPSGRVAVNQALLFGASLSVAGVIVLWGWFGAVTGVLGMLTSLLYLLVYTPLKRRTWHNTTVGAVPGAFPVLIGWSGNGGHLELSAWMLFAIVFFWQFPHFLSLAWLYRKDYARAGFRMLSVIDSEDSRRTSGINLLTSLMLAAVSAAYGIAEGLGMAYAVGAGAANGCMLWAAWSARRQADAGPAHVNRGARILFFASLAYLPVLMSAALVDML